MTALTDHRIESKNCGVDYSRHKGVRAAGREHTA